MTVCGDPVIVTTETETGLKDSDEIVDSEAEVDDGGNEKVEDDVVTEDVDDKTIDVVTEDVEDNAIDVVTEDVDNNAIDVVTSDVVDCVTGDLVIIAVDKVVDVVNVDDSTELIDKLLEMEGCSMDVDAKEDDVCVDEKSALVDNEACAMPVGLLSRI